MISKAGLQLDNVHISTREGKPIIKGLSLHIRQGEIHAIMGPNGGGKSTLAQAIMGHPAYTLTTGSIVLDGKHIESLTPDVRARLGLFLGFQYPAEVPGVNYVKFLRMAKQEMDPDSKDEGSLAFREHLQTTAKELGLHEAIASRSLNQDFSGGEKKKAEIVQLSMLKPKYAILDEPDSGLDVDALKQISDRLTSLDFPIGLLLITHYQRILQYIRPDAVHVVIDGRIVASGDHTLARDIEQHGYQRYGR